LPLACTTRYQHFAAHKTTSLEQVVLRAGHHGDMGQHSGTVSSCNKASHVLSDYARTLSGMVLLDCDIAGPHAGLVALYERGRSANARPWPPGASCASRLRCDSDAERERAPAAATETGSLSDWQASGELLECMSLAEGLGRGASLDATVLAGLRC
jgi:hypothetical protein